MNGTTTVQQILNKVAIDLMESDSTFPSGLWSVGEIIDYINYATEYFLNNTGVVVTDGTISSVIGTGIYTKPDDIGDIDRISYDGKRLRRVSNFDLMTINYKWRDVSGLPKYYHEDGVDLYEFEFDKKPTRVADIRIFGDYIHPKFVESDIASIVQIPDCWIPAIEWEVLSFCLQKDGESQDLRRATWAHNKFLYFISLCQRMITGQADTAITQIGE
jgi:hypothetical protein